MDDHKIILGDQAGSIQVLDFNESLPSDWGNSVNPRNPLVTPLVVSLPRSSIPNFDDAGRLEYSIF